MTSGESAAKIARDLDLGYERVRKVALGASYAWVRPTLVEQERARRAEGAHRERLRAERAAEVGQLEIVGLEMAAAPEGARRRRAPKHTPPATMPRSRTK